MGHPAQIASRKHMSDKTGISWEDFLNPATLRTKLIIASMYIAAFELLKNAIVDRIKNFYTLGLDKFDSEYQSKVLSKNRSPTHASLEWLKEAHAIDDSDVAVYERVKELRNELAHKLTGVLVQKLPAGLAERFAEMVCLLDKIERWWIVNVEASTNPQFDNEEIDPEGLIPGPVMGLQLMLTIALGPEEESNKYFDEFIKQTHGER
jgi:hypothetical protein